MNPNTEYELFVQEVFQGLQNLDSSHLLVNIQHNIKLTGRSGHAHQIDVYLEFELEGGIHRVAIECKNYKRKVSIDKVNAFYTVVSDIGNIKGMMVTKVGYQSGAKKIATHYGINLQELRTPNSGEGYLGEVGLNLDIRHRQCLYLVDGEWAKDNNLNFDRYRHSLDSMSLGWPTKKEWGNAMHIPLETIPNAKLVDEKGKEITSLDKLEKKLPEDSEPGTEIVFDFPNGYVETRRGLVKVFEVKYAYSRTKEQKIIAIDAQEFIKAILKDALSGEISLIGKNEIKHLI